MTENAAIETLRRRLYRVKRELAQAAVDFDSAQDNWEAVEKETTAEIADIEGVLKTLGYEEEEGT